MEELKEKLQKVHDKEETTSLAPSLVWLFEFFAIAVKEFETANAVKMCFIDNF